MSTTLEKRVKERMEAMGLNNAQLAAACEVKPPTSFNWASGKTKNIKGKPLLLAARALGVTPEWLASGTDPKASATPPVDANGASKAMTEEAASVSPSVLDLPPAQVLVALRRLLSAHSPTRRKTCSELLARLAIAPEDVDLSEELALLLRTPSVQTNDPLAA